MTIDKGNLFISTPNMKKNQNTSRIEGEKKSMKHHQPKPIHQYPKNKNWKFFDPFFLPCMFVYGFIISKSFIVLENFQQENKKTNKK